MGSWVFGCDVCQDVCPYNQGKAEASVDSRFIPDPRWTQWNAEEVLQMSAAEFEEYSQGSPIRRTGREGFARNLAIALGNLKSKRHLPVLNSVAQRDESPLVREAATWAVSQFEMETGSKPITCEKSLLT
jgi:epoxyqueuosine reductase